MGRVMDALVGGWKINSFVTFQTGRPLAVWENRNRLTDGRQRPNLSGHACSSPETSVQVVGNKFAEVRGEFFNSLNTVRFAAPGKAFGSGAFGIIGSQANSPRHGQFGVRFVF